MATKRLQTFLFTFVSIFLLLAAPNSHATNNVLPGYDLFSTSPGTFYDFQGFAGLGSLNFEGVPLGNFDFGAGPVGTGDADTIVRRLGTATDALPMIPIQIVELSLQSVSPIDIGNGNEFIVIGLNNDTGGSQMTINGLATEGDPHGTFDSQLNFQFTVTGTTSGFLGTLPTTITQSGATWGHQPNLGKPLIALVNFKLNGGDDDNDFWPKEPVTEAHPGPGVHVASGGTPESPIVPTVPPLGLAVLGLGLVAGMFMTMKRRATLQT